MITKDSIKSLKQGEIAALLDRDPKTIQRWGAEGLRRHGEGIGCRYVWAEVLPWYLGYMSRLNGAMNADDITDKDRKLKAEADMAEMEARKMEGTLIEVAEAERGWQEHVGNARSRLLQLPSKAAVRMEDGMTIGQRETIIREIVYEALAELAGREE